MRRKSRWLQGIEEFDWVVDGLCFANNPVDGEVCPGITWKAVRETIIEDVDVNVLWSEDGPFGEPFRCWDSFIKAREDRLFELISRCHVLSKR